jgi:CBS domain containing-hemolysin-like protein
MKISVNTYLLLFVIFLVLSAFISAVEVAFLAVRKAALGTYLNQESGAPLRRE